jgi:translocation and assembly module TamA
MVVRLLLLALTLTLTLAFPAAARADFPYEAEIVGTTDGQLLDDLRASSRLVQLEDRPPPSLASLRRRARDDVERLTKVANADGYWDARIEFTIERRAEPPKVTVKVEQGPVYRLATVVFETKGGGPPPVIEHYAPIAFGLELGAPARSGPVLAAEQKIAQALAHEGHPYGKVADRKVVVDHGTRTMAVTYVVDPGPAAAFGPAEITGLDHLDRSYVANRIAWKTGAPYDSRDVEATRKALVDSGLFGSVRIAPAPQPGPDGRVPMRIELTERLPRTIGAGIAYDTSTGVAVQGFWENRNLFGHAERLRTTVEFGESRLAASGNFRRPDFFSKDRDLVASAELADETPEAYTSQRLRLFTGIEQHFGPLLTGGAGVAFEQEFVDQLGNTQNYSLIGTPLYLRRDSSDDLLNPTTGTRLTLNLTPYTSVAGTEVSFLSSRVTGSVYHPLDAKARFIAAAYGAVGTILGSDRDTIPADKRLYAGGGGSVRGYGYQRAGPLGADDKPLGGKSSLELGFELRTRITDTIGIVPFVEAGSAFEDSLPYGKLFVGAGLGLRYFTPVGPVRLDIAAPVNGRSSDSPIQVYISLGQAF